MTMKVRILALCALCAAFAGVLPASHAEAPDNGAVSAPRTYEIGDPIPERRVAVMNLRVSGQYSEELREWLPVLIEDRLLAEGWTLVVRGERMQHIQQERTLPGVKPETRLPDQEILGATAFVELAARVQVKDIQGVVGYKVFSLGDYVRATVDVTGQIVDPATGVLKCSINVSGSASGLKTALVVRLGSDWRVGAGGYNVKGIRESLVGRAADEAAVKLIGRLKALYPTIPSQRPPASLQPSSTTVSVATAESTILLDLPENQPGAAGDRYGIYRGDELVAEVEIIRSFGRRAEARIISQTGGIKASDVARRMPVVVGVE